MGIGLLYPDSLTDSLASKQAPMAETRNLPEISPITSPHEGIMKLMTNRIINDTMGKIRRGNLIFVTWIGDHAPRHVHIFKRNKLLLKFDLERRKVIEGKINRRILRLIETLIEEGLL
jgi:hypothetical protein